MSDTDRQEMITQFCDITGEPAERAEFYLSSGNWTLQVRLCFQKLFRIIASIKLRNSFDVVTIYCVVEPVFEGL